MSARGSITCEETSATISGAGREMSSSARWYTLILPQHLSCSLLGNGSLWKKSLLTETCRYYPTNSSATRGGRAAVPAPGQSLMLTSESFCTDLQISHLKPSEEFTANSHNILTPAVSNALTILKARGKKTYCCNISWPGGSGCTRNVIYLSNNNGVTKRFFGIDDQLGKVDGLRITRGH